MESVRLYSTNKISLILAFGYERHEVDKYSKEISTKQIPYLKQKVYFLDNKFPKRILNKSKFIYCDNIDEAEIIAIPRGYSYISNWYYADKSPIDDKVYYVTWNNTPCHIAKYPSYDHKYLNILDDPRVITYKTLYSKCRKHLPPLTEDELLGIEELMNSLDKDVQLVGAMTIAKSNLRLSDNLCNKAMRIIRNSNINLTKELKAFINEY